MKKLVYMLAFAVFSNGLYAGSTPAAEATTPTEKIADAKTGVRTPTGDVSKFWDEIDWNDLSAEEKKLWSVLSDGASWNKLSTEERAAATALGFNKKSWNSVPAKAK